VRINGRITYRECRRPFFSGMLDRVATPLLQTENPAPYMTLNLDVAEAWQTGLPGAIHVGKIEREPVAPSRCGSRIPHLQRQRGGA
jgi:predicted NodU family carbamoyl transferase